MATHHSTPEAHYAAVKRYRERHLADGLCIDCARYTVNTKKTNKRIVVRRALPNRVRCAKHLEKDRECSDRYRLRQRMAEGRGKRKPGPKFVWNRKKKAKKSKKK